MSWSLFGPKKSCIPSSLKSLAGGYCSLFGLKNEKLPKTCDTCDKTNGTTKMAPTKEEEKLCRPYSFMNIRHTKM